jgi:hypothetical protein
MDLQPHAGRAGRSNGGRRERGGRFPKRNEPSSLPHKCGEVRAVVPMEITYMDTEDEYKYMVSKIHIFKVHIFKLFILYLEIIKIHTLKSIFRFPISSFGSSNFSFSEKLRRSVG